MPTVARGVYRWVFQRGTTLEDFADRLNHFWTFGILLVFAAILSWKQGYDAPMVCWSPAHFTEDMSRYVHSHCWNSHYIQYPQDILEAEEMMNLSSMPFWRGIPMPAVTFKYSAVPSELTLYSTTTTLYQWIPLILVFQALLFKLPNLLMYLCHGYFGLSFDKLSGLTQGYERLNMGERNTLTKQISRYIYNWCNQICFVLPWRFLTITWFLTKVLFFVNVIAQTSCLDRYLRTTNPPFDNSTSFGDVINDNLFSNNGSEWKQSPMFPRQVFCNFDIRQLGNVHQYTVTCDLPINEYSEVAFVFLWVWFVFVSIVTSLSLLVWLLGVLVPIPRQRYILKMLHVSEENSGLVNYKTSKFANWVGEDGVMALKLIGSNSSDLVVSDVVCHMWNRRQQETGNIQPAHAFQPQQPIQGHPQQLQQYPQPLQQHPQQLQQSPQPLQQPPQQLQQSPQQLQQPPQQLQQSPQPLQQPPQQLQQPPQQLQQSPQQLQQPPQASAPQGSSMYPSIDEKSKVA